MGLRRFKDKLVRALRGFREIGKWVLRQERANRCQDGALTSESLLTIARELINLKAAFHRGLD